jgi:hypothetical protein
MRLNENQNVLIYCGLINALIDHIDGDFRKSPFNKQNVKYLSNNLLNELLKIEAKIYDSEDEISTEVTEQYISAGKLMLDFFLLGVEMSNMQDDKRDLLNCDLNILLKRYGITQKF